MQDTGHPHPGKPGKARECESNHRKSGNICSRLCCVYPCDVLDMKPASGTVISRSRMSKHVSLFTQGYIRLTCDVYINVSVRNDICICISIATGFLDVAWDICDSWGILWRLGVWWRGPPVHNNCTNLNVSCRWSGATLCRFMLRFSLLCFCTVLSLVFRASAVDCVEKFVPNSTN